MTKKKGCDAEENGLACLHRPQCEEKKVVPDGSGDPTLAAIKRRHSDWRGLVDGVLVFEMPTGTGYRHGEPNRIDAWHMSVLPAQNFHRTSYEVKVSRRDFVRELRHPLKRRAAMRVSNQFYFVAPMGVIRVEEVPLGCGFLELEGGKLREVVKAPHRDGEPSSWAFFAAFARRLQFEGM